MFLDPCMFVHLVSLEKDQNKGVKTTGGDLLFDLCHCSCFRHYLACACSLSRY
jgi:hypothetical protein